MGKYTWPDGKIYDGGWVDGKQHGKARFTNTQGKSKTGMWENGERKEWLKSDKSANNSAIESSPQKQHPSQ